MSSLHALALVFVLALTPGAVSVREAEMGLGQAKSPPDLSRWAAMLEGMAKDQGQPQSEVMTQLSRAYYLIGEAEKEGVRRQAFLDKAIAASDKAFAAGAADCHALYWRSMAFLLKADIVGGLRALSMVKEALKGLETVSQKDESYDSAGAYRSRGKVLIDAPAWAFIGDKKKGLALLEKAKKVAPACLVNRLYLAEAYVMNGKREEAKLEVSYIIAAPVDDRNPKDDLEVKEDARKLLGNL